MKEKTKVIKMERNVRIKRKEERKNILLNGSSTRLYQELSVSKAEIIESV
jgi:hypothetical protein